MTYYPDALRLEMYLSGAWTDVSADVIPPITCIEGIMGTSPLDRVASAGRLTFTLDNGETNSAGLPGYYTPGHANARTGFNIGTQVRVYVEWEGIKRYRFFGRISPNGIQPTPGRFGDRATYVMAEDWFGQAEAHKINLPTYTTSKNAAEVVELVVANMPIAPQETDYLACADTFTYVFDTVRNKTLAIREIMKAVMSEWGYTYIKHNDATGEVLTVEGRGLRDPNTVSTISKANDQSGFLLLESGDYFLLETGDKLILNEAQDAVFDNQYVQQNPLMYGSEIYNRISTKIYPREVDAAATTVLFELNDTIRLAKSRTKTGIRGPYTDPSGAGRQTGGIEMVTPVSGTDYIANYASDGGGANATSDLVVTADYGTEAVEYTLQNTNSSDAIYVTTLQARGKGVYLYDPVEVVRTDSDSQDSYGVLPLTIDMKYQQNDDFIETLADALIAYYKQPHPMASPPWFCCNIDYKAMSAFLQLDIGDVIQFKDDQTGIDLNFYVQGHQWRIEDGSVIYYAPVIVYTIVTETEVNWWLGIDGLSELGITTYPG